MATRNPNPRRQSLSPAEKRSLRLRLEALNQIHEEILLTIYSDPELAARRTPEEVRDDLKEIGIDPATLPDRWKAIVADVECRKDQKQRD